MFEGCPPGSHLVVPLVVAAVNRWVVTSHVLTLCTFYIQRNSSTPLQREPACSSLAPAPPSTCTNTKFPQLLGPSPLNLPNVHFSRNATCVWPDSSLYGLSGGAADGIQAVCEFVLLVVQEPSRVDQTPHLDPPVALGLQMFCHVVHVQQDSCTPRAFNETDEFG